MWRPTSMPAWGKDGGVDRWQRARQWTAIGLYAAAAPLPPVAAWLLYDDRGPNAITLLITVVAGAVAALCLAGGVTAARCLHRVDPR
jgi:hypothetical protein